MKKYIFKLAAVLMLNAAFLIFNSPQAQAQIITTIAGNGIGGYTGDGGAATAAELNTPAGVVVDAAGNVYMTDFNNNRIRMVSTAGIISTYAGTGVGGFSGDGGQATAAELYNPTEVAVDAAGNVYVADQGNNSIRKVSTAGIISTFAGNGTMLSYSCTTCYGGDGGQATAAELWEPAGVVVDAVGNVYIADYGNSRIRTVNTAGIISTFAGNGTNAYSGDGGQASSAELYGPNGVAFDAAGNVYIADTDNNRIREVTTAGIISTIAGNGTTGYSGDGGQATAAELNLPYGIAVDAASNVYIAVERNNRIRTVSTAGIISTVAGNGTLGYSGDGGQATAAEFNYPYGVAIDAAGNLYIDDESNERIRTVSTAGIINTVAGNGAVGYTGDGGQATVASFNNPKGVAFDAASNVYIADYGNNCIRKVCVSACATTGIEQVTGINNQLSVWPNPTTSVINVQVGDFSTSLEMTICDVLGNVLIHNSEIVNHNCQLDVGSLTPGVYFVRVGATTQKFIKQ